MVFAVLAKPATTVRLIAANAMNRRAIFHQIQLAAQTSTARPKTASSGRMPPNEPRAQLEEAPMFTPLTLPGAPRRPDLASRLFGARAPTRISPSRAAE